MKKTRWFSQNIIINGLQVITYIYKCCFHIIYNLFGSSSVLFLRLLPLHHQDALTMDDTYFCFIWFEHRVAKLNIDVQFVVVRSSVIAILVAKKVGVV